MDLNIFLALLSIYEIFYSNVRKTVTTTEICDKLQNELSLFGTPKRIIMDVSTLVKNTFPKYLEDWKIEHYYIIPDVQIAP